MPSRDELKKGKTVVLFGGSSKERDVSLQTGAAMAKALASLGYDVETVDAADDMVSRLSAIDPRAVVIALHGRLGEDGCVQGLLECLGIPYSGSGVRPSAIAMDKAMTKRIVASVGVPTPEHQSFEARTLSSGDDIPLSVTLPVIVKPSREGSSVGIAIVERREDLWSAIEHAAGSDGQVLVERYIKGRELSVAVLEGTALGVIEIVPARTFYDYEAKYGVDSGTRYLCPAPISSEQSEELGELSVRVYEALGCSGVCRADYMIDEDGSPWFIEINTLPGMTATSLVPKMALAAGISFEELCEQLLLSARLKA